MTASVSISYDVRAESVDADRAAISVNGEHVGYMTVGASCLVRPEIAFNEETKKWETVKEGEYKPIIKFRHSRDASGRFIADLYEGEAETIDFTNPVTLARFTEKGTGVFIRAYERKGGIKRRIFRKELAKAV